VRLALLGFGIFNAILYAGLMPLWEGFDEPFHYSYIQQLWNTRSLPVERRTTLSEEVWQSIALAPASPVVRQNLPMVTTYDDFAHLPQHERVDRRRQLGQLNPALAAVPSQAPNYEALQVPLAYALLAPLNALWSQAPLPARVFRLRLVCAVSSAVAAGLLLVQLAGLLALDEAAQFAALFLLFSCQMFYATTTHVANDWLAVPLFLLVLTAAVKLYQQPTRANAILLALALTAGLLTKAYFLSMVPFALVIILLRRGAVEAILCAAVSLLPAAPLYIRNITLYGDLAGEQENIGGAPAGAMLRAIFQIPPIRALTTTLRESLWTGNNTFMTFSSATLWIMIGLLLAAAVYYVRGRPRSAEWVLLAGMATYAAGLAYNALVRFVSTNGAAVSPCPWYVQLLWPPAVCLLVSRAPRWLRAALCWAGAYIISATYLAKLIPMYAGNSARPAHLSDLTGWYMHSYPGMLDTTALLPPRLIALLTAAVVMSAVAVAIRLSLPYPNKAVVADLPRPVRP
jgi:hypothetical protein